MVNYQLGWCKTELSRTQSCARNLVQPNQCDCKDGRSFARENCQYLWDYRVPSELIFPPKQTVAAGQLRKVVGFRYIGLVIRYTSRDKRESTMCHCASWWFTEVRTHGSQEGGESKSRWSRQVSRENQDHGGSSRRAAIYCWNVEIGMRRANKALHPPVTELVVTITEGCERFVAQKVVRD